MFVGEICSHGMLCAGMRSLLLSAVKNKIPHLTRERFSFPRFEFPREFVFVSRAGAEVKFM